MPVTSKPNALPTPTRRAFCCAAASLLVGPGRWFRASAIAAGAQLAAIQANPLRPDVAAVDHDRILAAAASALTQQPMPLTSLPCPRSPGTAHDYYSEAEADPDATATKPAKGGVAAQAAFTAHRDALFALGRAVPALAGAYLLAGDERYAAHAALHLRAWFVNPATSMTPRLDYGHVLTAPAESTRPGALSLSGAAPSLAGPAVTHAGGTFEGILETLPLVEIAQAIPFLAASTALAEADRSGLHTWFAAYLRWLTEAQDSGPRLPALAAAGRRLRHHHRAPGHHAKVRGQLARRVPSSIQDGNAAGAALLRRHVCSRPVIAQPVPRLAHESGYARRAVCVADHAFREPVGVPA
jgi:hypothetical protein